jgi:microfibrillar-associated protein 1
MSAVRKQAPRPARPAARYWKGKAPKGVAEVATDSESDEEPLAQDQDDDIAIGGEQDIVEEEDDNIPIRTDPVKMVKGMNIALRDVNIRDGKVIVAGREESGRTALEEDGGPLSRLLMQELNL